MFSVFRHIGAVIRKMKPSVVREIIVIVIILIISIVLSLPEFNDDKETLRIWNETHENTESAE